jgi:hypothetical protein
LAEIIIGTLNSVVGYIICIHRVLFVHFSCLIQILNRNVYTSFVHMNPYTRHDWNIQARVEHKIVINDHSASKKVKLLLIDSQVIST